MFHLAFVKTTHFDNHYDFRTSSSYYLFFKTISFSFLIKALYFCHLTAIMLVSMITTEELLFIVRPIFRFELGFEICISFCIIPVVKKII